MNKRASLFIKFDIMNFNQPISKELLTKSTDYAKSIIPTEEEVTNKIFQTRNSLLFVTTNVCVKRR